MKFYSSRDSQYFVSAEDAIVGNLCPKGGLFLPEKIPSNNFIRKSEQLTLAELGFEIGKSFLIDSFNESQLERICTNAFNFPAPLVPLSDSLAVLELTHGPSLAFKDFGARFMAECLALISAKRSCEYSVLTATSGDTGGAVAAALHDKSGVEVTILYPKGRISPFQEGQMTKWGGNVRTVAVEGSFDDCQRLVKEAFSNSELSRSKNLVSANSINISRLLAQMVYYLHAFKLENFREDLVFVVPSGNLGNLTAGIFASRYAEFNCKFVAAHNRNCTFPEYLISGEYNPIDSKVTVSNAMDVGAPSNFERLNCFFGEDLNAIKKQILGVTINDSETLGEMKRSFDQYSYIACPHTAVALKAARELAGYKIVLATADPKKFSEVLLAAKIPFDDSDIKEEIDPPSFVIAAKLDELISVLD